MADAAALLRPVTEVLDSLGIAVCVFDAAEQVLLWNLSLLKFFPEHAEIRVGDTYRLNLRRFYQARLAPDQLPVLERYVDEGVLRHRKQQRPYTFEHRGLRLSVASMPLPGLGRMQIWQALDAKAGIPSGLTLPGRAGVAAPDGAALFEQVADGVMLTAPNDRIEWVNEAFVAMYGLRGSEAALAATFEDVYRGAWRGAGAEAHTLFDHGLATLTDHMRFSGAPFEVPLPGERWSRVVVQRSADGRGIFLHVDITVLKRQQRQLLLAERRARQSEAILKEKSAVLEITLQRMEQGVMMVSADRVVEVCNRRALELLDLPKEMMERRPSFAEVLAFQWATDEFVHTPDDIQEFVRAGGILDRPHCYDRKRPDGRVIEIRSVPIEGGGVLRTYTDITERKRAEERIRHVARHDGLTALVNREVFLEYLAGAAGNPGRIAEGFAVHYIDINRFKPVNDRYGHAIGDKVLAQIAERMRQIVRDGDVVARMGGDEFAVLQYDAGQRERALGLAWRLLEGIALVMEIETHRLQVGASIGIALCPAAGSDADVLLRNADTAMYAAKAKGSDCVRIFGVESRFASL